MADSDSEFKILIGSLIASHEALVELLIKKKVISQSEYRLRLEKHMEDVEQILDSPPETEGGESQE